MAALVIRRLRTTEPMPSQTSCSTKLINAYRVAIERKSSEMSIKSLELGLSTSIKADRGLLNAVAAMAVTKLNHLAAVAPLCGVPKKTYY